MVARRRQNWKGDADGQYSRQLGWKLSQSGKRFQPRFRLGLDERVAELREARLRALWGSVERAAAGDALWDETTLEIARNVARGEDYVQLPPLPGESDAAYCERIRTIQSWHPCHRAVPADELAFARGAGVPLESGFLMIDAWTIEAQERRGRSPVRRRRGRVADV